MDSIINLATDIDRDPSLQALSEKRLPLGDRKAMLVVCADGTFLAVRYTTGRGLLHEIGEKTLMPAIAKLRERSQWCYLIVSGNLHASDNGQTVASEITTKWTWNATQGALWSVQELGCTVVHIRSESDLPKTLSLLAARDHQHVRIRIPKEPLFMTPAQEILLSLPGIGETLCDQLLDHTNGNVIAALAALTSPDSSIPGIGPKTRSQVRKALGLKQGMTLQYVPGGNNELRNNHDTSDEHSAALAAA
jgi:hypothetical protein